jgi:hypothetical protein
MPQNMPSNMPGDSALGVPDCHIERKYWNGSSALILYSSRPAANDLAIGKVHLWGNRSKRALAEVVNCEQTGRSLIP